MPYLAAVQELSNSFTSVARWVLATCYVLVIVALAARMKRPRWPVLLAGALVGVGAYAMSSQLG